MTGTCLIKFLNDIYDSIEDACPSGVLFLDLKKAFDTVDLQKRRKNFGFSTFAVDWMDGYLSNRTQVTKVSNYLSAGIDIRSILGPLMFALHIDALPKALNDVNTYLYAGDTAIVVIDKDPVTISIKLNRALEQASLWFRNHKLSLNVSKTKFMPFSTLRRLISCVFPAVPYSGVENEMVNSY